MNSLILLLILVFGGALLSYLLNKFLPILRDGFVVLLMLLVNYVFFTMDSATQIEFEIGGIHLQWAFSSAAFLFGIIVSILGLLSITYSTAYMQGKDRLGYFYMNFLFSIGSMLGILMSRDLISLFFFWEIMTWSSYLIVIYSGKDVDKRGLKYIVFSAIGAYSMLMAIVIIYGFTGSFLLTDIFDSIFAIKASYQLAIAILLMIGFGVKSAMMPLHVWASGAYSGSPMPFTALFSGALSKMGVFGFSLVLFNLVSNQNWLINEIIAWLAAITAVLATFYAVIQSDAKKLLAYSSIAQLGYIVIGLASGTYLGVMAGLFLAVLHAVFKGTLFMAVGAVEKQAGTTDMTKVSGLIRKMPWTFTASLISIIALAGIPPLGGFVGKWMLYEALITSDHYYLVIMVFLSSTAAFLYSYRILFGLFLGQEEPEFAHVKEAPLPMLIPMLLLSGISVLSGTFPGFILEPIQNAMVSFGFDPRLPNIEWWQLSVLFNSWGDKVVLQNVMISITAVFLIALTLITWKGYKKQRYVSTKDISSSGEIIQAEDNMTFQIDFYKPFERAIWPLLKRKIDDYYTDFGNGLEALFDLVKRIYNGNGQFYAIYVMAFLALLLIAGTKYFGF
jgi:NADH-quinone oxidoreductase subunit M